MAETPPDAGRDPPRRRLLDRIAGTPTLIGAGARFEGDIETSGLLALNGTVVGDGVVHGALAIASGAHWQGTVRAATAVVAGAVTGDLVVEGKLEIGKTAVIRGNVHARTVAIANGALIDGGLTVTGDAPVVRFEEKRAPTIG
jgi:cytoskeletal protein CcmA (bactofilin family)